MLNWESLCSQRILLNPSGVREFMLTYGLTMFTQFFVSGRHVPLNYKAINKLFNLPDHDNNDYYSALFANNIEEMSERLLQEVTIPSTQWILSKNCNLTCRREHLTTEATV